MPTFVTTIKNSRDRHVNVYPEKPAVSHAKLYVAMSRARNSNNANFFIK
jgi:hypothetical protein